MKKLLLIALALIVLGGAGAMIPIGRDPGDAPGSTTGGPQMDLSAFSAEAPPQPLRLLYIHHSVGGTLFCDEGPERGDNCIYESHPNGGGLRTRLEQAGYEVHETAYGSRIGEATDLFDWLPKFRDQMDEILLVDHQDQRYDDDRRNQIVVFKSCFPNSAFVGEGSEPGNPAGPELTLSNARATMNALRDQLATRPDVLFVYMTAPPLAPPFKERAWRVAAKFLLGRTVGGQAKRDAAALARRFNNWVRSPEGWLAEYPHNNIVVFDYFDALTNHGESNMLLYATGGGTDSHPSAEGNRRTADEFMPFINRAVRRAGLAEPAATAEEAATSDDATPAAETDGASE
jgi:hypothetical protein